jgi:predicted RNA-binding protein
MHYYIIVVADNKGVGEDLSSREIFDLLLPLQVWDFHESAAGIKGLGKGDKLVFYLGGLKNQVFAGMASVASDIYRKSEKEPDPLRTKGKTNFGKRIQLEGVHVFERPLQIKGLIDKLDFIKRKDNYGLYIRRTAVSVPEADFDMIVREANRAQ